MSAVARDDAPLRGCKMCREWCVGAGRRCEAKGRSLAGLTAPYLVGVPFSFVRVIMSLMVVPCLVMTIVAVVVAVSFIVLFRRDGGFGLAATGQSNAAQAEHNRKR